MKKVKDHLNEQKFWDIFAISEDSNLFDAAVLMNKNKILEWTGVITAIVYSLLVALNIGAEFLGFALLLISAILIGLWAYLGNHRGILLLQIFYATAGIIGMFRWF